MARATALLLALVVVLAACGGEGGFPTTTQVEATTTTVVASSAPDATSPPGETTSTETSVDRTPEHLPEPVPPSEGSAVVGEVPADLLAAITADAADRAAVPAEELALVRAEQVIWNDGSLGCPLPGEFYTQATVSGYWVVLEGAGGRWDYRANEAGFFKYCEAPPPGGAPTG